MLLYDCHVFPVASGLFDICTAGYSSRLLTSDMRVLRINEQSLDVSCFCLSIWL